MPSPPDKRPATHRRYNESEKGKARLARYDKSEKGKFKKKRHQIDKKRPPGPAGSHGPVGAAAQRERRARPEYKLAKRLGVSVKVAREMLEAS